MQKPRHVKQHCIPKVLEGRHVICIHHSGSGKTVAFALPFLQRLAEHPFGVFALPWSDIPKLDLLIVINYDVPRVPQDYIHRVSGRGGFALNLVTQVGIALSTTDDG
ncbi:RNA helicase [Trifolium repens]|nr:RNA helicase [Trifolium repens]